MEKSLLFAAPNISQHLPPRPPSSPADFAPLRSLHASTFQSSSFSSSSPASCPQLLPSHSALNGNISCHSEVLPTWYPLQLSLLWEWQKTLQGICSHKVEECIYLEVSDERLQKESHLFANALPLSRETLRRHMPSLCNFFKFNKDLRYYKK